MLRFTSATDGQVIYISILHIISAVGVDDKDLRAKNAKTFIYTTNDGGQYVMEEPHEVEAAVSKNMSILFRNRM